MVAALITHSDVGFPMVDCSESGQALAEGVYAVTIVTTLDWIILSEFSEVKFVEGYVTATGVDAVPYVDGTTKNKIFVTGTGACTLLVKGIKA